ncbi:hypothetical protein TYRP_000803, partial [Tyrophagus putrescentiae]
FHQPHTAGPCPSLATFSIAFSLQVHLYSFCVLAVATPLFWSSKDKDSFLFEEPKWNRLDSSALSTVLLYAALFYLLPSAEFYLELVYFPDLKSSSLWTFGVSVSAAAGGDNGGGQLYFEVILATGCFVFCTMLTLFSAAYFLRASLLLNARQLSTVLAMLELVMHLSSQFLLRNPFSLLLVVIVWSVWKYVSSAPIDNGANLQWGQKEQLSNLQNCLLFNTEIQQKEKDVKEVMSFIDVEALKTKVNNSV